MEASGGERTESIWTVQPHHYEERTSLQIASAFLKAPSKSKDKVGEAVRSHAASVQTLLLERGFCPKGLDILAVWDSDHHVSSAAVQGLYYTHADSALWHGKRIYQCIAEVPNRPGELYCRPAYIFWSLPRHAWKIGPLDDNRVGIAFAQVDVDHPAEVPTGSWQLLAANAK